MSTMKQIDIHIQRSPHVTATDFDFLDSLIREPRFHIYAPELDGADDSVVPGLRKIANGDSKVYRDVMSRTDRNSSWASTFSALFMVKKQVESFDTTHAQQRENPILRGFGSAAIDLTRITSDQLIDGMPAQLERLSTFVHTRDTIIAGNIMERLPEIIDSNSRLKNLAQVGLLMTIGDNHRQLDTILAQEGVNVTTNEIPVTGAQEKASLKLLTGGTPSEQEVLDATAYSLVRSFVRHDSTYELRRQLNVFAEGTSEDDLKTTLNEIRKHGLSGIRHVVTEKIAARGTESDLEFVPPNSQALPIRLKETREIRNGIPGIRTGIF